jgi:tRNA(Ile)-lysidine synthase
VASLPRLRQANLLRWWLRQNGLGAPSEARLGAIQDDLLPARADAQPVVTWPTGEVRRYRGWLHAMRPQGSAGAGPWSLVPGQSLTIPGIGSLQLAPAIGNGISASRFPGPYQLALRQGGERLCPQGATVEKTVTRLLREAGTAPWLRDRVPLVYSEGRLLAVGARWIAAGAAAKAEEPGFIVDWTMPAGAA